MRLAPRRLWMGNTADDAARSRVMARGGGAAGPGQRGGASRALPLSRRDRRARGARRQHRQRLRLRANPRDGRGRGLSLRPRRGPPEGPDALPHHGLSRGRAPIDPPTARPPPDATSPPPSPAFGSTPTARCAPSPTPPACSRCSNSRSTPSDARAPAASSRRSQTRTTGAK